jgi:CBS domain containing-hemolysin-like protein
VLLYALYRTARGHAADVIVTPLAHGIASHRFSAAGIAAVLVSTIAIMIFGEIIPQSIACRYGMAMGANTIYITYVFVALLFPVAYPIAKACSRLALESPSPVADHVMDSLLH